MQRKLLLGGAFTLTLGLVGAPWIQGVLGSSDSSPSGEPAIPDESMMSDFPSPDSTMLGSESTALASRASSTSNPSSPTDSALEESEDAAPEELDDLLSAIEGLSQDFRGQGTPDFGAFDRSPAGRDDAAKTLDREALLNRYPLNSLVIGPERSFAQLGGELVTAGSTLSDGHSRVRRITAKGVELIHGRESIWMPLPPVRHVPASNSQAGGQPGSSAEAFPEDASGMNDTQAIPGP